ncbi:MAG: hypothetical protein ACI9JM_000305 [Halioglobus sp.]|jgi:hypothetical protein
MSRPVTTFLHRVKKYSKAHTIFDMRDLHILREEHRLELEVPHWKNLEFFLAKETDSTLFVGPIEKALLSQESFAEKVALASNIHSLEHCETGLGERGGLMFICGKLSGPMSSAYIQDVSRTTATPFSQCSVNVAKTRQ